MKVLSFGEILFDIIEGEHYLGGAPLNFAGHLARLGATAYIFSRVGEDALGNTALEQISKIGVKTSLVQRDKQHPTGTVPVEFREGQPAYAITEGVAYDFIDFGESRQILEKTDFDVLYFGTLVQRSQQSALALQQLVAAKQFSQIFYDINLRKDSFTPLIIQQSLKLCTILKLNDDEVVVLAKMFYGQELSLEDFAKRISRDHNISLIIITAGAEGCYVFREQQLHFVAGYPAKVVDTVGAGDAFSAAFLHYYFKEGDALKAADLANRLGAFVASSRGPLPEYSAAIKKALGLA